ncbi:MAG: phosphatidylglycerophosphatase A [Desulfosarcina sp.]|nr:phosphatidylglycerophosphatase A [Desulfobacterales bacterium]
MLLRDRGILFLATGCGCGKLPFAPGTAGSLAALPLGWMLSHQTPGLALVVVAVFAIIAIGIAHRAARLMQRKDPGAVVIDEIAGVLVASVGLQLSLVGSLVSVGLFRVFDIVKPFPVGWLDRRLKGGLGIVADDLAAGLLSNLAYRAGAWLMA